MEASLKARALRHLARREHTRAELERKLRATAAREARRVRDARDDSGTRGAGAARSSLGEVADSRDTGEGGDADLAPFEVATTADQTQLDARIRETLDELAARGLLSDARAAESLLATQGARLGQRRLRQVLVARGLAPDLVRDTLKQSSATEYERARDLWRRRFGEVPGDARAAARQMRFLAARGFDAEVIRRVMKHAPGADPEE